MPRCRRCDPRCVSRPDSFPPTPAQTASTPALASISIETGEPCRLSPRSLGQPSRAHPDEQEFEFLNAIGSHVSRRLDAIHFETEQRAHTCARSGSNGC